MPKEKVLIVDDDPALLNALCHAVSFRLPRVTVRTADSPTLAMEQMHAERPRAIISDMRMPNMTGLALLKEAQRVHPEVPFILMTGRGDPELAAEAFRAGAFDFIQKPFERDAFMSSLKAALTVSRLKAKITRRLSTLAELTRLIKVHENMVEGPCGNNPYSAESRKLRARSLILSRSSLEKIRKHHRLCEQALGRNEETITHTVEATRRQARQRLRHL